MSNDLTTSLPALVNFNPRQSSLLEIRQHPELFPRLKTIPREQAVFEMSKIVSQAFLYRGQAADPTNIQFISAALVQELMEDTKFGLNCLSLAEIQVVVKRAILGGSEMFGISVASLYKIILEFAKGEGHRNQQQVDQSEASTSENHPGNAMLQAYAAGFTKNHNVR